MMQDTKVDRVNISWRIDSDLLARVRKHIGAQSMESGERVLIQDVFESALERFLRRGEDQERFAALFEKLGEEITRVLGGPY